MMSQYALHQKLAALLAAGMGATLVTTVAGTNLMTLLLLLVVPWAFTKFRKTEVVSEKEQEFFALLLAICVWDVVANLFAGHTLQAASAALLHDMRTIGFILILWPVFSVGLVARSGLWSITAVVVGLATVNLLLTLLGYLRPGTYFWSAAPHMYGQMLVGVFFVLAQILLARPELGWRCAVPMLLLLASLFFASERRTGYLQFLAGLVVWVGLNYYRLKAFKNRRWLWGAALLILILVAASPVVQRRLAEVWVEIQQFIGQTDAQRTAKETAVGIRLQYYVSVWALITQSSWMTGVGTIDFPQKFWLINQSMGGVDPKLFSNPHNEYLYMLATKGVVGLLLYVAIFVQACRLAWDKKDELQRVALLVFVFLFMLSITTNSMMIDMEEGHLTLMILLIFLAPKSLDLLGSSGLKSQIIQH
jgi:O-antigen ligase